MKCSRSFVQFYQLDQHNLIYNSRVYIYVLFVLRVELTVVRYNLRTGNKTHVGHTHHHISQIIFHTAVEYCVELLTYMYQHVFLHLYDRHVCMNNANPKSYSKFLCMDDLRAQIKSTSLPSIGHIPGIHDTVFMAF